MNPTSTSTRTRTTTAAGPGTAPPLPADLEQVLRRMRLPYLRAAAPEVLATAKAQRWDPAEVLRVLLAEEVRGRDEATKAMRRKAAGLPAGKTFASWREADSSIPAPTQSALAALEWVHRAENFAISGPSGTGKTHFVEALAHKVIDEGMRVSWFTLESLTTAIGRAARPRRRRGWSIAASPSPAGSSRRGRSGFSRAPGRPRSPPPRPKPAARASPIRWRARSIRSTRTFRSTASAFASPRRARWRGTNCCSTRATSARQTASR